MGNDIQYAGELAANCKCLNSYNLTAWDRTNNTENWNGI